jgi:hypothetical protein
MTRSNLWLHQTKTRDEQMLTQGLFLCHLKNIQLGLVSVFNWSSITLSMPHSSQIIRGRPVSSPNIIFFYIRWPSGMSALWWRAIHLMRHGVARSRGAKRRGAGGWEQWLASGVTNSSTKGEESRDYYRIMANDQFYHCIVLLQTRRIFLSLLMPQSQNRPNTASMPWCTLFHVYHIRHIIGFLIQLYVCVRRPWNWSNTAEPWKGSDDKVSTPAPLTHRRWYSAAII